MKYTQEYMHTIQFTINVGRDHQVLSLFNNFVTAQQILQFITAQQVLSLCKQQGLSLRKHQVRYNTASSVTEQMFSQFQLQ
jgi:hypothetical protein